MKKIGCLFVLLGLICLPPAFAGSKKGSRSGGSSSGARSFSGGHASGVSHMSSAGASHGVRSSSVHTAHTSSAFHANSTAHTQSAHGLNASHGVAAQHGLNSSHGNFQSGKGLSAQHNARFAGNRNYAGHFRNYHQAFAGYHRQYHDRYWWHDHYNNVVFVGGGPYYWDGGYWYPAWGYDPAFVAYAYDGPIYSYENLPPDQVVMNVQDALQDQGYYTGEVDGQLGPKTRDAITAYQQDHGLEITSAVDEPTVESLGLG